MAAWRYEISLLALKTFHSFAALTRYFSTLEEKLRISAQPCDILYIFCSLCCLDTVAKRKKM